MNNLKAAVLEVDFYEATIQKNYADFAAHYSFLPEPCRVRTPTDKGKLESSVKYIKGNCFLGRNFKDYEQAKAFLVEWLKNIANSRIHGTTKKVTSDIFNFTRHNSLF